MVTAKSMLILSAAALDNAPDTRGAGHRVTHTNIALGGATPAISRL